MKDGVGLGLELGVVISFSARLASWFKLYSWIVVKGRGRAVLGKVNSPSNDEGIETGLLVTELGGHGMTGPATILRGGGGLSCCGVVVAVTAGDSALRKLPKAD